MSNFSDIGFYAETEEDYYQLIEKVYAKSKPIKVKEGVYAVYSDESGAELWLQFNKSRSNELIGINPHYKGKSKRLVCLTSRTDQNTSILDGSFHCWAEPTEPNNPESGTYPFIFDVPNYKEIGTIEFPKNYEIQLAAFAQELSVYDNEKDFDESQTTEFKFAVQSFIPSGVFPIDGEETQTPTATGIFTGIIKETEKKINNFKNNEFYYLLVETLGGEVDVVADVRFFEKEPVINGVIWGQFWLSGKLLNPPERKPQKESFFKSLFKK